MFQRDRGASGATVQTAAVCRDQGSTPWASTVNDTNEAARMSDKRGMTDFPLVIVDGPWPARTGRPCRDVTRELDPRTYPVHGLGPEEVVVLIENDPLNDNATEHGWSCVLDRRCLTTNDQPTA